MTIPRLRGSMTAASPAAPAPRLLVLLPSLGTTTELWDGVALFRHSRFLYPPLVADLFRPLAALRFQGLLPGTIRKMARNQRGREKSEKGHPVLRILNGERPHRRQKVVVQSEHGDHTRHRGLGEAPSRRHRENHQEQRKRDCG